MQVATIDIDQADARAQYAGYKRACKDKVARQAPEIQERLKREYREAAKLLGRLARGQRILLLSESFNLAGLDANGYPRLAISRADQEFVFCRRANSWRVQDGVLEFSMGDSARVPASASIAMPGHKLSYHPLRAVVPTIPPHLLPAGRLERYRILWEAEWTPVAPKDPILLSRIDGDAYAVLAQWDLSPIERLVLERRFKG